MENQVCIYTTNSEAEAIMLRDRLELEGILGVVLNTRDSSFATFGEIGLYVQPADVEKARAIIQQPNE